MASRTYCPAEVLSNPNIQKRICREVPRGRLMSPREDVDFNRVRQPENPKQKKICYCQMASWGLSPNRGT